MDRLGGEEVDIVVDEGELQDVHGKWRVFERVLQTECECVPPGEVDGNEGRGQQQSLLSRSQEAENKNC